MMNDTEMQNIMMRRTRSLFRDQMITILGPSPFLPDWPVSHQQAVELSDKVIAKMESEPDGGFSTMESFYREMYTEE